MGSRRPGNERPRWEEPHLEGRGFVTTDFHGDLRAFSFVEERFRTDPDLKWWIDLGDRFDTEKRRAEDASIPVDGDLQLFQRVVKLKGDLRKGDLKGKRYLEIRGNHDDRDIEVFEMLRRHKLLGRRRRSSLGTLLETVAKNEKWARSYAAQIHLYRDRYADWMHRLTLEDPGLSEEAAGVRFMIRVVYCQHGFAMRMRRREYKALKRITTLGVVLQPAGVVLTHGGIPHHRAEPWELAEGPLHVRRGYFWNRYPDDYKLADLQDFLLRAKANLLIVGHTPPQAIVQADPENSRLDRGVTVTGGCQIAFTSGCGANGSGAERVFLEIDADTRIASPEQVRIHRLP